MANTNAGRGELHERLRAAREEAGLSQGQTAKLMKMHRPTISEIEAGRRRVSAEEAARFADVYGVDLAWLMEAKSARENIDERIRLAARQLSGLSAEDLDKLLRLLRTLRREIKA